MHRSLLSSLIMLAASWGAYALTGSGDSAVGALETVSPRLDSASPATERSLSATFSEPMLLPGVATAGNYAASGPGAGTLNAFPDRVTGGGPYALSWAEGEMRTGAMGTVTATGLQDRAGNPIDVTHNSVSVAGLGVAPVFSNLSVNPSKASASQTVTITFMCSETLAGDPDVRLDAHNAARAGKVDGVTYTYQYVVRPDDPPGMAALSITGFDLAANPGALTSNDALEIVEASVELPLYTWPFGLALLAAGVVVLARKRRAGAAGLVLALLAALPGWAASPTVGGVAFHQAPNGNSTQVEIRFWLSAPNGPCDIKVWLSKDGGADGYVWPVTSVTGDLTHLNTGNDFQILWDIRADYPEEDMPQARIRVTADDGIVQHTVTYAAGANGAISGNSTQTVNNGDAGTAVTAVPDPHYRFVQWSDGSTLNPRTDSNVTADVSVTAHFALDRHSITCNVAGNGTCTADPPSVEYGFTSNIAVTPAVGWHVVLVVDSEDGPKQGSYTTTPVTANRVVTATFGLNSYDIACNVVGSGTCTADPPSVEHGFTSHVTVTPAAGSHIVSVVDSEEGLKPGSYTTTLVTANRTVTAVFDADRHVPVVNSFTMNGGVATTMPLEVTLDNTCQFTPTDYMASESASFTGALWQPYGTAPTFTLSFGVGTRTVYFKVRNPDGESGVVSDRIFVVPNTVSVGAGTFSMGRTDAGDDCVCGGSNELPVHDVTLGAYQLGRGEVTNKEYCDVLNWALTQGYLKTSTGAAWTGTDDIYAGGALELLVVITASDCDIQYSGGVFTPKARAGLPDVANYSMEKHPMVWVTWYGSVAFCNWLSLWQGVTPCYDMDTANWPLVVAPPIPGGYRLPTEAEWERAAAWDGTKHWIYGFMSDTNSGPGSNNRCNDYAYTGSHAHVNPLGLIAMPYTSPIAWFDGVNVSPNGSVTTVDSPSPVGAYDMSGNAYEWCNDWYSSTYYDGGSMANPTGPSTGSERVARGGSWNIIYHYCRTANRNYYAPTFAYYFYGFRLARS